MITAIITLRYDQNRTHYNQKHQWSYLENSLNSLIYNYPVIKEIIVINHTLSEDPQIEFIKSQYRHFVKIINLTVQYNPFNRSWLNNIGIKESTQDFIMFHDIDCIASPRLREIKSINSVLHFMLVGNNCTDDIHHDWTKFKFQDFDSHACQLHNLWSTSCIICSKQLLIEMRGYNEKLEAWGYDDGEFMGRLQRKRIPITLEFDKALHQPHTEGNYKKTGENVQFINQQNDLVNFLTWGDKQGPSI